MPVMFRSVSQYINREDGEGLEIMIWFWVEKLSMMRLTERSSPGLSCRMFCKACMS